MSVIRQYEHTTIQTDENTRKPAELFLRSLNTSQRKTGYTDHSIERVTTMQIFIDSNVHIRLNNSSEYTVYTRDDELAEAVAEKLTGMSQADVIDWLDAEMDNDAIRRWVKR